TIEQPAEPLLESVQLFDLFEIQKDVGPGPARKSLAYTLTYRDKNRTLTSEEVTAVHDRIKKPPKWELGVELHENVFNSDRESYAERCVENQCILLNGQPPTIDHFSQLST